MWDVVVRVGVGDGCEEGVGRGCEGGCGTWL